MVREEVQKGIRIVIEQLESSGLTVAHRKLGNRSLEYFGVTSEDENKKSDFVLSEEFLMDLPNMAEHRDHVSEYLQLLANRFQNFSPNDFYSKSGTPFTFDIHWPFQMIANRDATHARVVVMDLAHPGSIAKIEAVIWGGLHDDLKFKPCQRIQLVTDAIRDALDSSKVAFYDSESHPERLQAIEIGDVQKYSRAEEARVQQFLAWKVYWMGFKRGDKRTKVWIADPWDANYLGVTPQDLAELYQGYTPGLIKVNDNLGYREPRMIYVLDRCDHAYGILIEQDGAFVAGGM